MTGYTAKLMEEGQTFREFALTCARAFGACIHMRDEASDKLPTPMEVDPCHRRNFEEAKKRLEDLMALANDPEAQAAYLVKKKRKNIEDMQCWQEERLQQEARRTAMLARVTDWDPPTPEHRELKKFMIEQLEISDAHVDYYTHAIAQAESTTLPQMFEDELDSAQRRVAYYEQSLIQAIARTERNNEWILALYENLNECEQADE